MQDEITWSGWKKLEEYLLGQWFHLQRGRNRAELEHYDDKEEKNKKECTISFSCTWREH